MRDTYPGDNEQGPTDAQRALMDRLIDESLEGVECELSTSLFYEDESLHILVSRDSQCVYENGGINKREIDTSTPRIAKELWRSDEDRDEVVVKANLKHEPPAERGSVVEIRFTDDGVVTAHLQRAQGTEREPFDREGEYIRAEATGNESMVDANVGRAITALVEFIKNSAWKGDKLPPEQSAELLDHIEGVQKELKEEGWGERLSDEEALRLSQDMVTICTAQGTSFCSIDTSLGEQNNNVSISIDPFNTSYLGAGVTKLICVTRGSIHEFSPCLYYMSDGEIIFCSTYLPNGPKGDYRMISPRSPVYKNAMNAKIRSATSDDFAFFLSALQKM